MATIVCPNCGYKQESGARCQKCASLFAYHEPAGEQASAPSPKPFGDRGSIATAGTPTPALDASGIPLLPILKGVYRVIQWSSLAILIVTVLLVLRKAPPPQIPSDPQAAARAEAKLRASDAATQAGQPHEVQLDKTEVNSFLSSNLALAGSAAAASSPAAAAPQPGSSAAPPSDVSGPAEVSGSSAGNGSASPTVAAPGPGSSEREPSLEKVQSSVKDVKVDMDADLVKAYVVFDFHGKDLSLILEGHLHAENGYVRFEPTSGMLGSLPLPQSALDATVSRLMSSPENREKMRLPADISNIRVADGHLVVDYK